MEGGDLLTVTLVTTCLTSSVVVALVNLLVPRFFKKSDDRDKTAKEIKKMRAQLDDISYDSKLNDAQTHLLMLINHYPTEKRAIMMEAEKYFVELEGDSWVYNILKDWSDNNDVDISYITINHEKNLKRLNDNQEGS